VWSLKRNAVIFYECLIWVLFPFPGKTEAYLEAIRKNIEWLKKHNKKGNKEDYDLSKMRDFINQQADAYVEKGILDKEEADAIKRIYSSL